MTRERLERRAYENMALLRDEENIMEVNRMTKEQQERQMDLFRKRLQKENSIKPKKRSYRKLAAAMVILSLLPCSIYAAIHYESIKEVWLTNFEWGEDRLNLAKIHDENWGKEEQKKTVYEAFGVKVTIYSCFYDQDGDNMYLSYKTEDSSEVFRFVDGCFGCAPLSGLFVDNDKEVICADIEWVGKDGDVKEGFFGGSVAWTGAENGLVYMRLTRNRDEKQESEGYIPKVVFTKRTIDEYSEDLENWEIVETKCFDMPKAEQLKVQTISAEEDQSLKLKISQQSLCLNVDSRQNQKVDIESLIGKKAKIYTKDGMFEMANSSGYTNRTDIGEITELEYEYTLAGADLSKIEKIKIGKYTFLL